MIPNTPTRKTYCGNESKTGNDNAGYKSKMVRTIKWSKLLEIHKPVCREKFRSVRVCSGVRGLYPAISMAPDSHHNASSSNRCRLFVFRFVLATQCLQLTVIHFRVRTAQFRESLLFRLSSNLTGGLLMSLTVCTRLVNHPPHSLPHTPADLLYMLPRDS